MFKSNKSLVQNQKEKKIKILRSDRGAKYFPTKFDSFCEENGLIHNNTILTSIKWFGRKKKIGPLLKS